MEQLPITAKEYYLVNPGKFEEREFLIEKIPETFTLLSPLYTAICGSDKQYYRGEKHPEKLSQRLPLILLHEGVCIDRLTETRVVPIAWDNRNVPDAFLGRENLYPHISYLGATMPGLARTHFLYPKKLTMPASLGIPNKVTSLTEPLSVGIKAVKDLGVNFTDRIAIIGTGGLAFLLVLALSYYLKIPASNIFTLGLDDKQLILFKDLCRTVNYREMKISADLQDYFHVVFEAVGRKHINTTINLAIELVRPGGRIGVLGISDSDMNLPVNKLVNQGITIRGLTRSTVIEYHTALDLLAVPLVASLVKSRLVNSRSFVLNSVSDLQEAFEFADSPQGYGRIVLRWPN